MKKYAAIVLSAGSGSRMKSDIPKQYLPLIEKPVIYYSLMAFQNSPVDEIILVSGANDIEYCRKEIVERYGLSKVTRIVAGGKERYDSVYEGLCATHAEYVLIHDGARPVLTSDMIDRMIQGVENTGACIAAMPVKDTIKLSDEHKQVASTPDRNHLWMVQTPQCFARTLLEESYEILKCKQKAGEKVPDITDDAMIVEYATGKKITLVEGAYTNLKITTPEDLAVAEIFLKSLQLES